MADSISISHSNNGDIAIDTQSGQLTISDGSGNWNTIQGIGSGAPDGTIQLPEDFNSLVSRVDKVIKQLKAQTILIALLEDEVEELKQSKKKKNIKKV